MTRLEKSSQRKCKAIKLLVDTGEYSASYGLLLVEEFYDKGKIIDNDYDEICEYLESLLEEPVEETGEAEEAKAVEESMPL